MSTTQGTLAAQALAYYRCPLQSARAAFEMQSMEGRYSPATSTTAGPGKARSSHLRAWMSAALTHHLMMQAPAGLMALTQHHQLAAQYQ